MNTLQRIVLFGVLKIVLTESPASPRMSCNAVGNHSVPGSCTAYLACVEDGTGIPRPKSCGLRQAFSPLLGRCVEETLVKGCNVTLRLTDRMQIHVPSLDPVCADAPNQYLCANCKTLVNCINGKAFPSVCGSGDFCYSDHTSFGSSVCYPGLPQSCVCDEKEVFYQDAYDRGSFFLCDKYGETHLHHCPEGQVFDEREVQCKSVSGLPACVTPGVFAVLEDCSRYYACIVTEEGWLQHAFTCPQTHGPSMYNEETGRCEDPCNWQLPDFVCKDEGRFADPMDCRKFFVCTLDSDTGDFRQLSRQCPEGYEWEQIVRDGTGRCVPMSSEECAPRYVTQCHIPQNLCT